MPSTLRTRKRGRAVARGWQGALAILLAVLLNGCPPPADQPPVDQPPNDEQFNGGDSTDQGTADSQSDGTASGDASSDGTGMGTGDGQSDGSVAGDGSVAKPDRLRVFGTTLGPPNYELRWTYAGDTVAQSFTVYESDAALSAADPAKAIATLAGSARAASIQLSPGTGQRHILVSAKTDSTSEALSSEYVVDTTLRLAFIVVGPHSEGRAVYVATPDRGGEPVCVSGATQAKSDAVFTEWSPDGRFVATVGDYESEGTFQVYVAASDGSSFTAVSGALPGSTDVSGVISRLAWSPDATRLAYCVLSVGTGGLVDLYVVAPAAPAPTVIARGLRPCAGPGWSADGELLWYVVDPNATGAFEGYTVPADGSAPPTKVSGPLVTGGNVQGQLAWSPGGQWLAFLSDKDVAGQVELYVMPASGGEPTKVSGPMVAGAPGLTPSDQPVWSPDGTQIAYSAVVESSDVYHGAYYIATMPPGNLPMKVSGSLDLCGTGPSPMWSPDGTHLAWSVPPWPDCNSKEYVVSPGEEPVLVSGSVCSSICDYLPFWSPDSTRVAFPTNTGLYVATADAGGEPMLVSGRGLPLGRIFQGPPYWSPDSTQLAFVAETDEQGHSRLFVVPADGSGNRVDLSGAAVTDDRRVLEAAVIWSRLSN